MDSPGKQDLQSRSILCDYMFRYVGVAAVVLGTPYAIADFIQGQILLGMVGAGLVLLFLVDLLDVRYRGGRIVNRAALLALTGVVLCYMVYAKGPALIYWSYPLVIAFYFILETRTAALLTAFLLCLLLPLVAATMGWADTLRIAAALVASSVFASVFEMLVNRQRSALEQQVVTDPLTGAYNRRYFGVRIAELVQRRKRHGHPASMILFDIDHFKHINDVHGHEVGDRVLRILVETVKARIRLTDEIFRYGGEEFVILLPDTPIDHAMTLAEDITDMIAEVRMIEGGPVTISCGVGELQAGEEARDWLKRCDVALYTAKSEGRGRACRAPVDLPGDSPAGVRELDAPRSFNAG